MHHAPAVQSYFEARAANYERRSSRGPWKLIRSLELKALRALWGRLAGLDALDLGCGSGFYAEHMQKAGAAVQGIDFSPAMIRELNVNGLTGVCADATSFRLGRKFDFLLAAGLIEFIEDERLFFSAARAHCASAGRLLILAPRSGMIGLLYRLWHALGSCHCRVRTRAELTDAAASAGWQLHTSRGAGPLARALLFVSNGDA